MGQITIDLPNELHERLLREAKRLGRPPQDRIRDILEVQIAPADMPSADRMASGLSRLRDLLDRIPAVTVLGAGGEHEPYWWVKCEIDIASRIAWHVVQELGFVLNEISVTERLPTVFMPVSPPPYLNGGPESFLYWVIESKLPFVDAGEIARVLEERLPRPIENEQSWLEP